MKDLTLNDVIETALISSGKGYASKIKKFMLKKHRKTHLSKLDPFEYKSVYDFCLQLNS